MEADMRALAVTSRDSGPEVTDVPDRAPDAGEVRVQVEAASVNGFDVAAASGRLWDYMPHTFPVTIGRDFAGTVAAIGEGVTGFAPGDRVAGVDTRLELGPGPIAESCTVPAEELARVPHAVTLVQAAAAGLAAITALDLTGALSLAAGETVLVSGATGGVGAFAVQLAAAYPLDKTADALDAGGKLGKIVITV
jgi:NADPH:quinone reductase-like Zn-dependent oxidoreductase